MIVWRLMSFRPRYAFHCLSERVRKLCVHRCLVWIFIDKEHRVQNLVQCPDHATLHHTHIMSGAWESLREYGKPVRVLRRYETCLRMQVSPIQECHHVQSVCHIVLSRTLCMYVHIPSTKPPTVVYEDQTASKPLAVTLPSVVKCTKA
jgi:hypothetical protein